MELLEKFGPKHAIKHFVNICNIPHPSEHEQALCSYIKNFADEHGHKYYEDKEGNLIVYVDGTPGYENAPAFLMQAHMDMISAKTEESKHNFLTDPISLRLVEDRYLYADGTTLGADNAVGMMYMLALMEDKTVVHPPLELLFTVTEEVGLIGIRAVEFDKISARGMINMDCGDPDELCVSTAGAAQCKVRLPLTKEAVCGELLELNIGGLLGGHAGLRIDLGRLSAITAMGRVMCAAAKKAPFNIVYTSCDRMNGIAVAMKAVISVKTEDVALVKDTIEAAAADICKEYANPEKDMFIKVSEYNGEAYTEMLDVKTSESLMRLLYLLPFGVTKRDWQEKDFVLCSNNTIEVAFGEEYAEMEMMVRAPEDIAKEDLVAKIDIIAQLCGAELIILDSFAGWPCRRDSRLEKLARETYTELTGGTLKVVKENACAETGIIAGAIPDMDIIAIAPLGRDAHTPYEHLDMETVEPFWQFLVLLLKKLCTK